MVQFEVNEPIRSIIGVLQDKCALRHGSEASDGDGDDDGNHGTTTRTKITPASAADKTSKQLALFLCAPSLSLGELMQLAELMRVYKLCDGQATGVNVVGKSEIRYLLSVATPCKEEEEEKEGQYASGDGEQQRYLREMRSRSDNLSYERMTRNIAQGGGDLPQEGIGTSIKGMNKMLGMFFNIILSLVGVFIAVYYLFQNTYNDKKLVSSALRKTQILDFVYWACSERMVRFLAGLFVFASV